MGCNHIFQPMTRRQALARLGGGFGLVALSNMLNTSLAAAAQAGAKPIAHRRRRSARCTSSRAPSA